ncbi:DUF7344 domain-containing protein [Halomarina rubra]|uniref:DUF7344 domain-containing protein n=1 Tax=Halomarina rubra TaxID=2071873 RepID=A0ABD6ATK9_9EURY|nr:hypothetical protein [Halomarina rubra]
MGGTDGTPTGPDDWDELFLVLADERRRRLLAHLHRHRGTLAVSSLAASLAENDTGPTAGPDGSAVRDSRNRLYHVDLPALADRGLVAWDREAGAVELGDRADEFPLFDPLPDGLVGTPERSAPPTEATLPGQGVEKTDD